MITLGPTRAVAIGDTYGAQFEYRRDEWAHLNTGEFYSKHMTHLDLEPGKYTDDTQMSIAIAELMLTAVADEELPAEPAIAARFMNVYLRDPHVGYSKGMLAGIHKAHKERIPLEDICATFGKTEKSGAAMRATTIGMISNPKMLRQFARLQGSVTHQGSALKAAEAAALAAHYMLYKVGPRANLPTYITSKMQNMVWMEPWKRPVGAPGMDSTRAALTAVVQATSLKDLLIRSCAFTGDVDTVAAIAMGCAWAYDDLPNDLPDSLWDGLENGPYGRGYLTKLDNQLLEAFPVPAVARLAA